MPVATNSMRRLLVVDDDDADMISFLRTKDRAGLEVEVMRARDAIEAKEMLLLQCVQGRSHQILLLLDLNMPCMNGIEFLADLRRTPELQNTVVIAVSGSTDPRDVRAAYSHHVAAYVVKGEGSADRVVRLVGAWFDAVTLPPA